MGTGLAIAVVALDWHRFFAQCRLSAHQRWVAGGLATLTMIAAAAAAAAAAACAVAGLDVEPALVVATALGIAGGVYAAAVHLRRLRRLDDRH